MAETRTRTVRLPSLTTELESAELLAWLVAEGDEVREGDPLAEVTTDKVEMELEAPYGGTVTELLQEAGAVLDVGDPMATIATADEGFDLGLDGDDSEDPAAEQDAGSSRPATATGAAATQDDGADAAAATDASPSSDAPSTNGTVPAPPAVRHRAEELDIDLREVERSGSRGQVTMADLEAAGDQARPSTTGDAAPAEGAVTETTGDDGASGDGGRRHALPESPEERRRAAVRAATARSTTRSQRVPQFTLFRTADVTERNQRREGVSWTTIIARELAATLWRHPMLNATWDEEAERAVPRDGVRIGLAVDTPAGLMVVGLDDPDKLHARDADARLGDAAERAREGTLRPDDMRGASTTVSNLGGFGVERFTALLLPPQASILSVGAIAERAVVRDGGVEPRLCVDLGLTVDHRVADGADGARALTTLVELLEDG